MDGDSVMGMGHVFRCIALAGMLKDEFEIIFVVKSSSNYDPILNAGFRMSILPESVDIEKEPKWLKNNFNNPCFVVLDGYPFSKSYQEQIRSSGNKLFYIDDLMNGIQVADVVINHCPGIMKSHYQTSMHTKLALGLGFSLLRQSFLEFDSKSRKKISAIQSILVSFGGSNPGGFSFKSVEQLLKLKELKEIHLLGGSPQDFSSLEKEGSPKLLVHSFLNEKQVFNLMKSVDLAIVPSSTGSLELAALNTPMILGYFVENQKNIYEGLKGISCVHGIGDYNLFDFANLKEIVRGLNNYKFLNSEGLASLFEGIPSNNILNLFRNEALSVREVTREDVRFIFDLANDPLSRVNSYHSNEISFEQHEIWFADQINSSHRAFYIVEYNGTSMAQVRFSFEDQNAVIGVSIVEKYRGKRLGSLVLKKAISTYSESFQMPIYAYIKQENTSSVKSFERAGFSFFRNEIVQGVNSFVYKIEIN